MAVEIQLSPQLEKQLKAKAKAAGTDLASLIARLLEDRFPPSEAGNPKQKTEAGLLKKINQGFSEKFWEEYFSLVEKRKAATLSQAEHHRLISLTDKIEMRNVQRIKYLSELAKIKGIDIDQLIDQMGLRPKGHA